MKTLGELIVEKQRESSHATGGLTALLSAIKLGAKIIHHNINKAGLVDILGTNGAENVQGEVQQKLDLFADEKLRAALRMRDIVTDIASEEEDGVVIFKGCEHIKYVVLMDPLDSPPNIDVNVSVGTIFSIYRRVAPVGIPITEGDFLQPGNRQVAAGYVVYGSSTMLAYTTDYDVHTFTYDPSLDVFCLNQERMRFPAKGSTYSISEGNYIKFSNDVKKYIKFCQKEDKPTQHPYTSRYIGLLIVDFHRNPLKDGVYLYSSIAGHPQGKLRLLYECNPMTFLAKQTGGKTSDGKERILDIAPESLYQRRSFFVGNDHMIEGVERFIREFPDA